MKDDEFEFRLRDLLIPHAVYLTRYATGLRNRAVRSLNRALKGLEGEMAKRLIKIEERGFDIGPATSRRIEQQIKEINAIVKGAYETTNAKILEELSELAQDEVDFTTKAIKSVKKSIQDDYRPPKPPKGEPQQPRIRIEGEFPTHSPAPSMVRAIVETNPLAGKHLKAWTDKLSADTQAEVGKAIRDGLQSGRTVEQIVRDIAGSKRLGTTGVLDASRKSIEAMVRTAVTHVHNIAAQQSYAANDDVVKGWRYLSVLDSRTTPFCMAHSGKEYPIGQGPIPPNHVRCRSLSQPVTATLRELGLDIDESQDPGTRASDQGPLRGDITYDQFLRGKSAAYQDELIGPARGKAFRTGKLKLADLVREDGRELTLKELRALHPDAFQ